MAARGPFTRHPPLQVPVSRMLRSRRHRPQGTPKAASEWSHAAWPQRTLHLRPSDRLDLGTQDARPPPQPRTSRQGEGGRPPSAGRRHWLWGSGVRGGAPSWQTWPISIGSFHQRAVVLAWMATQGWPHRNRTAHCPQRPPCWAPGCTWCPRPYPSRTHRGMPGLRPIPPTASRDSVPSPSHTARTGATAGAPSA